MRLTECAVTFGIVNLCEASVRNQLEAFEQRDPAAGIFDYDVNYYDASDLSWEAEEKAIAGAAAVFDGVEGRVEVRNEARVHLWYEAKFGVSCPPYRSTRHAIATFPNCNSCCARSRCRLRGQDTALGAGMAAAHGPAVAG